MRNPACRFQTVIRPAFLALALLLASANAQNMWNRSEFGRSYGQGSAEAEREQQEMAQSLKPGFQNDVFTFARLRFNTDGGYALGGGRRWDDDCPEADLNLIYRLFQVTSLRLQPGLHIIDITTRELEQYPFVYMACAGRMVFSDSEVEDMRRYLDNGGFLMAEDFWGDEQWAHFYEQIKRLYPNREPVELSLDHPIFHAVYSFKKEPQMPSVGTFFQYNSSYEPAWPYYQKNHDPHYYAVYDKKNRMVMLICHNNHYGDGWEHESDDESYFKAFSEPMAYPMFINILQYTMTH